MNLDRKLEIIRKLQAKHEDLYLSGSIGLLIQGIDLGRECNDIDLVKECVGDLDLSKFKDLTTVEPDAGGSRDMHYKTDYEGVKIEIEINPKVPCRTIRFDRHDYEVVPEWYTLGHKMKYALVKDIGEKHKRDILHLLGCSSKDFTKEVAEVKYNDDLPF